MSRSPTRLHRQTEGVQKTKSVPLELPRLRIIPFTESKALIIASTSSTLLLLMELLSPGNLLRPPAPRDPPSGGICPLASSPMP